MKTNLKGTGVAIVTPFRNDSSIDFNSLSKLINYTIENGVDYIVVLGTTGEAATMNTDEKNAVVNFLSEVVENRCPVVKGIGGNNTNQVVSEIKATDFDNIDAILSVSPYYNKPGQKGIYQHYKAIANASPVPVIIYNVPGRTGSNIKAETTLSLAHDLDNIIAVKEASGDLDQIASIVKDKPKNFTVLSGDDNLGVASIAMGAEGIISVTANAFPREFSSMINAALSNKFNEARKFHFMLKDIMNALFMDGNPAGIKAALSIKGLITNNLRLPLTPVSRANYNLLNSLIETHDLQTTA